ncbi:type I polyketide synthase [Myxococcaceae bacterium JPH2]|nr:type I polyketide synthase [Myxococcaceae bacterium JPH2]
MSAHPSDTGYGDLMKRALLKLQEAQSRLDAHERAKHEPIAIIGMGCRFPGGVTTPEQYWRLLSEGRDAITEVPATRWDVDSFHHPDPDAPGRVSSRFGGFLDRIDQFEPRFFGISPREAARMDPQHRLLLECTWEALESSGRNPTSLQGTRTGVFIGMMGQDYTQIATQSPELIDAHTGAGNGASVASGRLSYTFGLQGPSLTVDTACSSSLVAVHLALRSLRQQEVDFAVAGGVNLVLSPVASLIESRAHMLSPDGRCKAFDASANGIGRGEGCGVIVLRRLSDAIAHGDPIVAVLRGSAVNQDGRTSGLTVPNGLAQRQVIQDALKDARVDASQVGYVEAHGTGTALGDPIELEALAAAYGDKAARSQPLVVGSVKTNLGHLEGAAGIAGLIKSALCLSRERIPAHLHLRNPSPHVDWNRLFIEVPTTPRDWQAGEPRFAAVSSFGFSGTNAHLILESAPRPAQSAVHEERPWHLLGLSARTVGSLRTLSGDVANVLGAEHLGTLAEVCHAANVGRTSLEERAAFIAPTTASMAEALRGFQQGLATEPGAWVQGRKGLEVPRLAFLFSGQGAQYVGMGRELFATHPDFRSDLLRYEAILRPHLERPLTQVLFEARDGALDETRFTQPALVALELALARLLQSWGLQPDALLGHSVGEYAAALFSGVMEPEEGLPLVAERARLMQALPERGTMLAVLADEARVAPLLSAYPRVSRAALNGPRNTVLSGDAASLDALSRTLAAEGVECRRLKVSHAFHSPLMEPMVADFERAAGRVAMRTSRIPLISNLDGEEGGEAMARPGYWARHVLAPVRYAAGIQTLVRRGVRAFLEVGPKPVLVGLAREGRVPEDAVWLETLHPRRGDWQGLLRSLAELYVRGVEVDWTRFDGAPTRRRVSLPTYPFERQRHWLEVPAPWARQAPRSSAHPLLGARWDSMALREGTTVFAGELRASSLPFLSEHRVHGKAVVPATAFVEMVASAAARVLGSESLTLEEFTLHQALVLSEQRATRVQTLVEQRGDAGWTCTLVSKEDESAEDGPRASAGWRTHVTCRLSVLDAPRPRGDRNAWKRSCPEQVSVEDFTAAIRERGLDYGPSLRLLESLHRGRHAAFSVSQVEAGPDTFRAHPALLDACLRTAAAVTPLAPEDPLLLPVALQRIDLYEPLPARVWTHATQRSSLGAAGLPVTDLTVCGEDGAVVATLTGLTVRKADRDALLRGLDGELPDCVYRTAWSPAQAVTPPRLAGQHWVLFADAGGAGALLASQLTARGARVTQVRRGAEPSRAAERLSVDAASPESIAALLTRWADAPPQVCLYLWDVDAPRDAEPRLDALDAPLLLVQGMLRATWRTAPRFVVVTRGTQRLGLEPVAPNVAQAPLWGFAQAIATEAPELKCLRVDLPAEPVEEDFDLLLRACALPDSEAQAVVRERRLHTARLERIRPRSAPSRDVAVLPDATYLIAGGLGGLGLHLAGWLAHKGARHVVLLGRHAPTEEASARIASLREQGVDVRVALADIAVRTDVATVLEGLRSGPPLRGVIHAAGVLRDGTLGSQSPARFHEVLAPKVLGAWNLHVLTREDALDFFVGFSSVASLIGTPGQSNYVAANAFLDGLAHLRHALDLPALTLNWGSWGEAGMAARLRSADAPPPGALGLGALSVEQGLAFLDRLLARAHVQVGVFPVDWARLAEQLPGLARQALVQGLLELPAGSRRQAPAFRARWESAPPARRLELLRQHVAGQVAATLGLAEADAPTGSERLFDLGFDSLLAVELKNRLATSLGRSLRTTLVFDFPTVSGLVAHLGEELGLGDAAPSPEPTGRPVQDVMAEEIQGLSEQELTALIDQELESALTR